MHNPHPALDPLVTELSKSNSRIGCVFAYRFADLAKTIWLRCSNPFVRIIEYCELAAYIIHRRRKDAIFVREFSTYFFLISLVLTIPLRKKILLLNAHNVQSANNNLIEKVILNLYLFSGCRIIMLETRDHLLSVIWTQNLSRILCINHPTPHFMANKYDNHFSIRVGMVGDFHPDKNMQPVLINLSRICKHEGIFKLEIGTKTFPLRLPPDVSCVVHDTREADCYIEFLKNIDILLVPYPAKKYFFRASGIIAEAISCGTFIITTNLPSLANQVLNPVPVGLVIDENAFVTDELKRALLRVRSMIHVKHDNQRLYCLARSGVSIAKELEKELERSVI